MAAGIVHLVFLDFLGRNLKPLRAGGGRFVLFLLEILALFRFGELPDGKFVIACDLISLMRQRVDL
jgi:hypothetical protein